MIQVTLSEGAQEVAKLLATTRTDTNRKFGVKDTQVGTQERSEIELEGVASEIAFAELYNVMFDMTTEPRSGGADCILWDGRRVDVKCTKYPTGKLLLKPDAITADVDIYVLMVGTFPTYTFIGWAYTEELAHPDNITDLGHGPTYALEQDRLRRRL